MDEKKLSPGKHEILLSRLRAPDEVVRVHAALRLSGSRIDADLVRPALEQALTDADSHVRRLAGWVLARLGRGEQAA
jgi:hypothetical protein